MSSTLAYPHIDIPQAISKCYPPICTILQKQSVYPPYPPSISSSPALSKEYSAYRPLVGIFSVYLKRWDNGNRVFVMSVISQYWSIVIYIYIYISVRVNGSWFVIRDEDLNFHDWILCYRQPFHDIIKREK